MQFAAPPVSGVTIAPPVLGLAQSTASSAEQKARTPVWLYQRVCTHTVGDQQWARSNRSAQRVHQVAALATVSDVVSQRAIPPGRPCLNRYSQRGTSALHAIRPGNQARRVTYGRIPDCGSPRPSTNLPPPPSPPPPPPLPHPHTSPRAWFPGDWAVERRRAPLADRFRLRPAWWMAHWLTTSLTVARAATWWTRWACGWSEPTVDHLRCGCGPGCLQPDRRTCLLLG